MAHYTFITFAPIQSFIEKSRKLRDLYGASLILSYLSQELIKAVNKKGGTIISPGQIDTKKGMPNRILLTGNFSKQDAEEAIIHAWSDVLDVCRNWLKKEIRYFRETQGKQNYEYTWQSEWDKWKSKTWEVFWGTGDSPEEARKDLENRKLARQWTAINWIGESSSISGADAIAYPRMAGEGIQIVNKDEEESEDETQKRKCKFPKTDPKQIKEFYRDLAQMFDTHRTEWRQQTENSEAEGRFIADNERLSIPELVKRLITHYSVAKKLGIEPPQKFGGMVRRASNTGQDIDGHWTGWFMGDGDKMGDVLQNIADKYSSEKLKEFSEDVHSWGSEFQDEFFRNSDVPGRVIYAGGDDFLGVLYSKDPHQPIPEFQAYQFLQDLHQEWEKLRTTVWENYEESLTVSVGFVWVAPGVPQRDVLQHCREAEKRSKSLGRDRITIRIVFNNGQYVQWTTPWSELSLLEEYRDREGNTNEKANWTHIYNDWAHLKSRHAIDLSLTETEIQADLVDEGIALALFDLYFKQQADRVSENREEIVGSDSSLKLIRWINDLICVGWQLCSDT